MEKNVTVGRERIVSLFDEGTFVEIGAFLKKEGGTPTGVVCGYGAVNGKLAYAFAQDSDLQKGAFDATGANKILSLYQMALKNGAPVIGLFDSVGGFVKDGATALSAYGTLLQTVSNASGAIPQIAVIPGVCSGMAATAAAMFDLVITVEKQTKWFVNAPFLVGREVGSAAYAAENGLSSVTAKNEAEAINVARNLVDLLPANCNDRALPDEMNDDVNRAVAVEGISGKAKIQAIADNGVFFETGAGYANEMLTGFVRMGGVCCGIVANNPEVKEGALTSEGAKKAAKLVNFCDSFGIPVLTLCDSVGVAASSAEEGTPLAAQLAKLAMAYATAKTAKITVVAGKAYGAAFTLMGSKALGADMVYALPNASVSVLAPEAAVAFLWNDQISETCTRDALVEKWNAEVASPEMAAADGSVDDIIEPAELRQRICAAVFMRTVESADALVRKHCNLPL